MDTHEALVKAAFELFLNTDYHKVTTRKIAERAGTSTSMIQYYFGGKQELYEEMVRRQFMRIGEVLDASFSDEKGIDFSMLMHGYLKIHQEHPDFPAFITSILAYKNGPGYMLFARILDDKRDAIAAMIQHGIDSGTFRQDLEVDVLRIAMMSLTVFPFLIKGVLEHSLKTAMNDQLLSQVATAAGEMLAAYVRSPVQSAS